MRTGHLLNMLSVVGILSIASSGCSSDGRVNDNSNSDDGSGGATTPGSGRSGGSGTAHETGGAAGGGATGSGGSAGHDTTEGSGGSSKVGKGGSPGSGGTAGLGGKPGGVGGKKTDAGVGSGGTSITGGGSGTGGTSSIKDAGSKDSGSTGRGGSTGGGTCTVSKAVGSTLSGSGSHKVVMESNSDSGINCGTIYRPQDLGGAEKYPIFVWGEGACTRDGTSNQAAMAEIASHGYFVVADGPSGGGGGNCGSIGMSSGGSVMSKPLLDYITWAIAENDKSCSAYYQSLDTTKVAADGFSCGGLMAEYTAGDPRMTAVGITSSGLTGPDQAFYKTIHTPVKILLGGSGDVAYTNGERDFEQISALGVPIVLFSKNNAGHGGDLGGKTGNGGDFTKVNLAWLNWQLKGDEGDTGKGFLTGASCKFCTASGWEYKSKNIQ